MKCSKCGAELLDNSSFCPYCGTKTEEVVKPKVKFCPNCQKAVSAEKEQCECGYRFVEVINEKKEEKPQNQEAGCWAIFAKVSRILGIVTISTFWIPIFGIMAIAPGIEGIIFGCLGKVSKKPAAREMASSGFTKCLVGSILSIVAYVVWLRIIINSGL